MSGFNRLMRGVGLAMLIVLAPIVIGAQTEASSDSGALWRSSGGSLGVWVARQQDNSFRLLLGEIIEEKPSLRPALTLGELPRFMIGAADGPLLIFEARGEGPQRMYPIRQGDFEDRAGVAITGSLIAMPPLVTMDRLVCGVSAGGRIYLLAASSESDRGAVLYTHENRQWLSVRLPVELADASLTPESLRLLEVGGRLGVLLDGPTEDLSVLWTLAEIDFSVDPAMEGYPSRWESIEIPLDLRNRAAIATAVGDEAVVIAETDGGVECVLLRRQGAIRIAMLEERSMPVAVAATSDRLWLLSDASEGEIEALVIDRDGTVVAEGTLGEAPRRAGEDGVLFMLLVAWSVVISGLILMMQQGRRIRIVIPPEGYALAEPSRRLFAGLIDLLPGMAVVSLLWGKPLAWWLSPLHEIVAADGSMPVFALAWITFGYMSLADGLTGRTIGRALTGCRVVSEDGQAPGIRRAAARSFLKVFCPPLVVVMLLMPYAPSPWSFGTVVVRKVTKGREEE